MKKAIITVISLLAVSLTLGADWTQKRVTNNRGRSVTPAIAVSGQNVYVVWSDDTPGDSEIFFQKSTDGGVTGRPAKGLTINSGDSEHPDIAVNGRTVYVVWNDNTPGNHEIFFLKSNDGGQHWIPAKRLTDTAGGSFCPRIEVKGSILYLTWHEKTEDPGWPESDDIYFMKSWNGGAAWQPAQRLTNNSGDSRYPSIAVSGSNVYLVWADLTPGNYEIFFRKSTDGGESWETMKRYTNNTELSWRPEIAVNGPNVYFVYSDYHPSGTGEIFFMKSTDNGATWQKARRLTKNLYVSDFPDVAIIDTKIYVVYTEDTEGRTEIFVQKSADSGEHWPIALKLSDNKGSSWMPRLAISNSKVYVVWYDDTPGNDEIYFAYSPL